MRRVQFDEPGPPSVLKVVDAPVPKPGPGEILVKAHTIGVGIPDILIRSGAYGWMPPLPATPGTEMAGTIVEAGADVGALSVGQRVYVSARERPHRGGCYAEMILVRHDEVYAIPDGASDEGVATLANYQVAWHLLNSVARAKAGDTVLVYAAAGGVGSAAVELAKVAGLSVIGIATGPERGAFVKRMGAAGVVDRKRDDILARVKEMTGGRGVDIVLDPAGGPRAVDRLALLAPLGQLIIYGHLDGRLEGDVAGTLKARFGDSIGMRTFSMHSFDEDKPRRAEATAALMADLASGRLQPAIHDRLPLAEAQRAHELLESGQVLGKLLLVP